MSSGIGKYKVRTITCVSCGKTVTKRMPAGRHYCSLACYRQSERPQRKTGEEVPCRLCGKPVYISRSRTKSTSDFFCCKEHANQWQGRNKTLHVCAVCGKEFKWSPSRTKAYNIKYCSIPCRNADPENRDRLMRMNVAQQAIKPNNLERAGYAMLDTIGVPYSRQYVIGDKFCVDAFVPSLDTVIQFDGDYWHGNPDKFPQPDERQTKRIRLDKSQDAYMAACGYRVIRIWESEIKKAPEHVRELLLSALIQP